MKQRGILSYLFFNYYIYDITEETNKSDIGLNSTNIVLTYADNIILFSPSVNEL